MRVASVPMAAAKTSVSRSTRTAETVTSPRPPHVSKYPDGSSESVPSYTAVTKYPNMPDGSAGARAPSNSQTSATMAFVPRFRSRAVMAVASSSGYSFTRSSCESIRAKV